MYVCVFLQVRKYIYDLTTLLSFLIAEYCMQIHQDRERDRNTHSLLNFWRRLVPPPPPPHKNGKSMHAATATRSFASNSNNNNKTTTTATTTAACHVYCVAFFFVTKLLLEFHIMCIYLLSKLLAN